MTTEQAKSISTHAYVCGFQGWCEGILSSSAYIDRLGQETLRLETGVDLPWSEIEAVWVAAYKQGVRDLERDLDKVCGEEAQDGR